MSNPYEQTVGRALQNAAATIPAPPESRWIPDTRERSSGRGIALAVAAVMVILLIGIAISLPPRSVPAAPSDPFTIAEDAAWAQVRSALPSALVLRPTWLPDEFKRTDSTDCPSPAVSIQNASGTFAVTYLGTHFRMPGIRNPDAPAQGCSRVEIKTLTISPADSFYGVQLVDVAPITARGTTVRVRVGPRVFDVNGQPHQLIYMNWLEGGTSYELNTLDASLTDLTRVLVSLAPQR